jgi:hypothetical protein
MQRLVDRVYRSQLQPLLIMPAVWICCLALQGRVTVALASILCWCCLMGSLR